MVSRTRIERTGYGAVVRGPYGSITTILSTDVREAAGGAGHTVKEGVTVMRNRAKELQESGITLTDSETLLKPDGVEGARVAARLTELSVMEED